MGQINYTFNPKNMCDLVDLFDLLHKYYPEIPSDYRKIGSASSSDSEKDKVIRELKNEIEMHKIENEKNAARISELEQQVKETEELCKIAENDSDRLSQQISDLKTENERLVAEHTEKEQKLFNDFQDKQKRITEEKGKEITSLNKQLSDLEKRLAVYEPSLSGETGEDKYFDIDGVNLRETLNYSAPFIGKVDANGNAIFNFNSDKGQHLYYSQNPSELELFCDIIDSIEGANHIGLGEWGKGKYNRGLLVKMSKAKIKLTRE